MKYNYKIIWIDDYPDDMQVHRNLIETAVKNRNMNAVGLDRPFTSIQEFQTKIVDRIDETSFFDYDLILVDYNLSDRNGRSGIDVIKLLRERGIYTDVIFYSGNTADMFKKIKAEDLDNVTYSDNARDRFLIKFNCVLEKQMNLIMQISDLRGYLMDSSSDFDFTAKNYVEKIYSQLSDSDKTEVLEKIKERIEKQKTTEIGKFEKIDKIQDPQKLVKEAMDAIEYITTARDKMYIFGLIVQKYTGKSDDYALSFENEYYDDIINKRNKLAHSKLVYGEKQNGHIKIAKSISDLTCQNCESCNSKMDKSDCENLREKIQKYYLIFDSFLNEIK